MRFVDTRCPICLSLEDYEVLYPKNFEAADLSADVYSARRMPDRIHYQIVRCRRDGMVRANPVPEEAFVNELYKQSKFTYEHETENLAATYPDKVKEMEQAWLKHAEELKALAMQDRPQNSPGKANAHKKPAAKSSD